MQIDSIPDVLRSNPTQNIIFVGNNVRAKAIAASQPKKTVLLPSLFPQGIGELTMRRSCCRQPLRAAKQTAIYKTQGQHRLAFCVFFKFICATELERDALRLLSPSELIVTPYIELPSFTANKFC